MMARIGRRLVSTAATQPPGIGPSNGTYKLLAVLEDHAVASPTCCLPSHSSSHPCASFTRLAACPLCPCEQQLTCTTAQMCSACTGGRRYSTQTWSRAAGRQRCVTPRSAVLAALSCCFCGSALPSFCKHSIAQPTAQCIGTGRGLALLYAGIMSLGRLRGRLCDQPVHVGSPHPAADAM
jgi:hypothetical protein